MSKFFFYIYFLSIFNLIAQDKAPVLPRFSIRVNCGIPNSVTSTAFRTTFSAVGTGEASINCILYSNVFFGVGYSFTYYQAQKSFRDQGVNTNMQSQNGYIKIGYDHFFSNNGFTTVSFNTGINTNEYYGAVYKADSLRATTPLSYNSFFVEPQLGVYFIVDPKLAIGGHIGYNYNFSQFNPKNGGFNNWLDYAKISNKWNISSMIVGIGFYYGLARNK